MTKLNARLNSPAIYLKLRSSCKFTIDRLLPDVGIDILGDEFLFFGCKRRRRKTGKNLVKDKNLDIGLGLLLLPEAIEFSQSGFYRRQQLPAGLLDPRLFYNPSVSVTQR